MPSTCSSMSARPGTTSCSRRSLAKAMQMADGQLKRYLAIIQLKADTPLADLARRVPGLQRFISELSNGEMEQAFRSRRDISSECSSKARSQKRSSDLYWTKQPVTGMVFLFSKPDLLQLPKCSDVQLLGFSIIEDDE